MKRSRESRFAVRERGLRRVRTVTALTAVGGVTLATALGVSLAQPSAATPTQGDSNPGQPQQQQPQQQQPQQQPRQQLPQQPPPQPQNGGGGIPHALSGGP